MMRAHRAGAAVLLLLVMTGTSGCAAAGLAGAPIVAAVQAVTDRAVERTVLADLTTAAFATEAVLRQASIDVKDRENAADRLTLRGSGEKISVVATLERVTSTMTKVSMRTETGGVLADRQSSERLQQQLATTLDRLTGQQPASDELQYRGAITALEAEVRRLREQMTSAGARAGSSVTPNARPVVDEPVVAEPVPTTSTLSAAPPRSTFTVDPRSVVSVDEAYGLATVAASRAAATPAVPTARRDEARGRVEPPLSTEAGAPPVGVLSPVSAIQPVAPVTGSRAAD